MAARSPAADGEELLALLYTDWANKAEYAALLQRRGVPVVDAAELQQCGAAAWRRVAMGIVWRPPPGLLARCPDLRLVQSLGAGVDTLLAPGQVPGGCPIARIVDPLMASRMATWVLWGVINWQRRMEAYGAAQRACSWDQSIEARANRDNCEVAVGVLGLGVMGLATARALQGLGYVVSGWTRGPGSPAQQQARTGIRQFAGRQQLEAFVRQQDVLVCLLPLTPETEGLLDARLLSWLRPGSALINGGRGRQLVEPDLLAALDSGRLDFALLDVFDPEPLPPRSRLWSHPRVRLTPHVASMTTLETAADQIAANWRALLAGQGPPAASLVQRDRGY